MTAPDSGRCVGRGFPLSPSSGSYHILPPVILTAALRGEGHSQPDFTWRQLRFREI